MGFDRARLPDASSYFEGQGLRLGGPRSAKWRTTRCEFHGGSDSMRVHVETGGWVCMNCGVKGGDVLAYQMTATGADFVSAAKELGAWIDDGTSAPRRTPPPLPARQALSVLAFEATLTAIAAGNLARGVHLTDVDRSRLLRAANRIIKITGAYQ